MREFEAYGPVKKVCNTSTLPSGFITKKLEICTIFLYFFRFDWFKMFLLINLVDMPLLSTTTPGT